MKCTRKLQMLKNLISMFLVLHFYFFAIKIFCVTTVSIWENGCIAVYSCQLNGSVCLFIDCIRSFILLLLSLALIVSNIFIWNQCKLSWCRAGKYTGTYFFLRIEWLYFMILDLPKHKIWYFILKLLKKCNFQRCVSCMRNG